MQLTHVVVLNWKDGHHPEAGGAEVFCENVARELAADGIRVTYLTSRPRGHAAHDTADGYVVRRLGGTYGVYLLALLWLFKHRAGIDAVIDSQNGIPFFSPLAVGRRVAVTQLIHHVHQDQFGMYFPAPVAAFGRLLEGPVARRVYGERAVCAVSPSTRTEIRRRLRLRGPVYVTPNGHRPSGAPPVPRADRPTITCVGRVTTHKRLELLIDAVGTVRASVPDLVVNIVGAGPASDDLRARVDRAGLGDHVVLHGFVSAARRDELAGAAWLTVSTSVGEGWGLSVIEAAAQGVPAVALDVPGLRDSVRDGLTGWLCAEADLATSIVAALDLLRDEQQADRIAEACRAWASSLRWSSTASRLTSVLTAETRGGVTARRRRRARQDSVTAVTLSRDVARGIDTTRLRTTDQATFCAACVDRIDGPWMLLLSGADEFGAAAAMSRLGVNPLSAGVSIELCRSTRLVQWHGGAVPHNDLTHQTEERCPHMRLTPADRAAVERWIA